VQSILHATDPTLSNCDFSNNKTSSSDFGNVVYSSDNNNVYSPSNIINTCSINSNPHITGNNKSVILEMIKCFLPNNIFSNICVLSAYFCDMYIS
jgi:hypothetical protein